LGILSATSFIARGKGMPKIPQEYFTKVLNYYLGDHAEAWRWFRTVQPNLIGGTPLKMLGEGKQDRVMRHIDSVMFNPKENKSVDDRLKELFKQIGES
jgi:Protein of unknown function (DUF2384)